MYPKDEWRKWIVIVMCKEIKIVLKITIDKKNFIQAYTNAIH